MRVPTATWWDVFRAKLFGKRFVRFESGVFVSGYQWRGVLYVTGVTGPSITTFRGRLNGPNDRLLFRDAR